MQTSAMRQGATKSATRPATRRATNRHTGGLLPFQPRPELPKEVSKEAKRLHSLGVSITDIHRLLSDPHSHIKVKGYNNKNFNYYDFWDLLGYNGRKEAKKMAMA